MSSPSSTHDSKLVDAQLDICESLQILAQKRHVENDQIFSDIARSTTGNRPPGIDHRLKLLDAICVCLTTGERGHVVAATLTTREANDIFLLATNSQEESDAANSNRFFEFFNKTEAEELSILGVLQVISRWSKKNMYERASKVRLSLEKFEETLLATLKDYEFGSDTKEFRSDHIAVENFQGKDRWLASYQIFSNFLNEAQDTQSTSLSQDNIQDFSLITKLAFLLMETTFLGHFFAPVTRNDDGVSQRGAKVDEALAKFYRRMAKLAQYQRGISRIISHYRSTGTFHHEWVTGNQSVREIDPPAAVELASNAYEAALRMDIAPRDITPAEFYSSYPEDSDWRAIIHPVYHAEICVILAVDELEGNNYDGTARISRAVGCSKHSCIACFLWIWSYNGCLWQKEKWMTAGSHGKPYPNWALPPCNEEVAESLANRLKLDTLAYFDWPKAQNTDPLASDDEVSPDGSQGSNPEFPWGGDEVGKAMKVWESIKSKPARG